MATAHRQLWWIASLSVSVSVGCGSDGGDADRADSGVGNTWTAFLDVGADGACALVADTEFTLDTVIFHDDELDGPAATYFIYPVQPWYLSVNDTACTFNNGPSERLECPVLLAEGAKHIGLANLEDLRRVDVTTSMDRETHRLTLLALSVE